MSQNKIDERFEFIVSLSNQITKPDLEQIHSLFATIYRDANHAYLEKSLQTLRYVATAKDGNVLAGFALGDSILTAIPGFDEEQTVILGGLGCISDDYRRQGLFGYLEKLAIHASGISFQNKRVLSAGRMAHPVGFRSMSSNPSVVPKPATPVTSWQKEVGLCVAKLYKVSLDPESFVVKGSGTPIGYPNIVVDVPDSQWQVFKKVNRDKGDSLLGIAWSPDAPPGW